MSRSKGTPRHDRASILYKSNRSKGACFEHAGFSKGSSIKSEVKSNYSLSTKELVSAVGQIWDRANHASDSESKLNANRVSLVDLGGEDVGGRALDIDSVCFKNSECTPRMQQKLEFLKLAEKLAISEGCILPYLCQFLNNGNLLTSSMTGREYARLGKIYGWLSEVVPTSVQLLEAERTEFSQSCVSKSLISNTGECVSGHVIRSLDSSVFRDADCYSNLVNSKDESICSNREIESNASVAGHLYSDYLLGSLPETNVNYSIPKSICSSLHVDHHLEHLSTVNVSNSNNDQNEVPESAGKLSKLIVGEEHGNGIHSSADNKSHCVLAKQEHAFAGAFAGIFVSVFLHPVDTVKTVIQSCRIEQMSICSIGRSIISEKGVMGLYRGIASNMVSSAPISGIYTFTYESVKGSLLPFFSKEYHSFVHCIAGGCSSVATSFVFTPSERIKQQMQIGSHYQNCWNALVGIMGKGGLPSLYTGWGAVLCRNVPHSIIKFYTYERLKKSMFSTTSSSEPPDALHTLVCGGLAGSTAALFTTPFDVVKTRLQTQIPGSTNQYHSVFHTLQQISKTEGLKGLYRGLMPRLFMYMSQGALFFASYEFLKRLFSMELPQHKAEGNYFKELEDDTTLKIP